MFKILLLIALGGTLLYLFARRFGLASRTFSTPRQKIAPNDWIAVSLGRDTLKRIVARTLTTVGIGFVLLLLTLVLAAKFKIILLLLPISFYLIGQYFTLLNHINVIKSTQFYFNSDSNELLISKKDNIQVHISLNGDLPLSLREIKSVQKNNGILLGYYELRTSDAVHYIPYLLVENPQNKIFFDRLQLFPHEIESKLFPII